MERPIEKAHRFCDYFLNGVVHSRENEINIEDFNYMEIWGSIFNEFYWYLNYKFCGSNSEYEECYSWIRISSAPPVSYS